MMADDTASNGGSLFTQKEMLVRIDAKVDVIAAKQAGYDVELALIRARQEQMEATVRERARWGDSKIEELGADLEKISEEASAISARQKATAIVVAAIVTISTILTPIVLRVIG